MIIPSHNGERWLSEALQSLVEQKECGIEVIVVDTSAGDVSLQIAESYSERLNIRAYRRPDLLPWTAKTNFGVAQASSEHICMLHQDDLWHPNRCVKLREWLSASLGGVIHLHASYIIDESGKRLGLWRCPLPDGDSPVPTHTLFERLLVQNFIAIPAPTIRRDAYLSVGGLDDSLWYTADWDLYLKIASIGDVYYHSDPLAGFRVHKNSLTVLGSRNISDFRRQHEVVVDRYQEKLLPEHRQEVLRLSTASIEVNTALAAAAAGEYSQLMKAFLAVLALGPQGMRRYFFCSRIADRVVPRLRALAAGRF